jgi:anti-sigma factor RsiW
MPLSNEERENLVAYLDGELDEEAAQALEARLNRDPQIRAEVEALRQTWTLLDYLPRAQPSETFTNKTMERLTLVRSGARTGIMPRPRAGSRLGWIGWAAAVLLALGGGLFGARWWFARTATDVDDTLVRHLRVLEKWRTYEHVDDLDFLRSLDHPDLFGDDSGS